MLGGVDAAVVGGRVVEGREVEVGGNVVVVGTVVVVVEDVVVLVVVVGDEVVVVGDEVVVGLVGVLGVKLPVTRNWSTSEMSPDTTYSLRWSPGHDVWLIVRCPVIVGVATSEPDACRFDPLDVKDTCDPGEVGMP